MNLSRIVHGCPTSRLFRKFRLILPLCLLFVIIGPHHVLAQNESGVRFLVSGGANHPGYDSTRDWYHKQFPIIRSLPPLNSGMPSEVLSAYVHLDSFARFNVNGDLVQSTMVAPAWLAQPDLLKKTVAAYYAVMDYDPVMFEQYDFETGLKIRKRYKTPIGLVTEELPDVLAQAASLPREGEALKAVFMPDYVLHVKVVTIDSMSMNWPGYSPLGTHIFSVTADILDTLKGRVIPFCEQNIVPSGSSMPEGTYSRVRFQYFPGYPRLYDQFRRLQADSTFLMPGQRGPRTFTLRVGQEFIVPLTVSNWKLDTMYDYFNLTMDRVAQYTLPVIDGQVRDVNRYWSDNLLMSYADWRRRFVEIREKILSGTY